MDTRLIWSYVFISVSVKSGPIITKTRLFKYIENFTTKKKTENFQIKHSDIFHISAQNIDCGTR